MILIKDLLAPWFHYAGSEAIDQMTLDSRQVQAGSLFVAVPGYQVDGREFIDTAIQQGAAAVLAHTDEPEHHGQVSYKPQGSVPVISFFQLTRQLSAVAGQCYPLQVSQTKFIGITGTNGKTSVSQLIAQIAELLNQKAAVMGTLGNGMWGKLVETGNTTADAVTLAKQLAKFQTLGAQICAMEVSSHGLVQGRVEAVPFEVAVFTNLSRDHLDYHGDMDAYGAAKKRLFTFPHLKSAVLNVDDAVGEQWFAELSTQPSKTALGYSTQASKFADIFTENARYHYAGVDAEICWPRGRGKIQSPLLGEFNLSNLLAALAALYAAGENMEQMLAVVPQLKAVPGRMEKFASANEQTKGVSLVVDYAHTPDAIEQALKALRVHCRGKLWCIFGCGGDRDQGKRPLMARAAEQYADCIVVTSDNPRSESPEAIIAQVVSGLEMPQSATVIAERKDAIQKALQNAQSGDILLLAGKGHETYQEVAGQKRFYDERQFAAEIMSNARGASL